jgi:hypothetical protein
MSAATWLNLSVGVLYHRLVRSRSHSSTQWPSYQDTCIYTGSDYWSVIPYVQWSNLQEVVTSLGVLQMACVHPPPPRSGEGAHRLFPYSSRTWVQRESGVMSLHSGPLRHSFTRGGACLSAVTSLIHYSEGHMSGWSSHVMLILDQVILS